METLWFALVFLVGLGILYLGAEGTIHGSVGIARRLGISSLLMGLTLVAYGTSAPELAIDLSAAIQGKTDLAFGDLVGSNIANLGLILGVAVSIRPLKLESTLIRFEIPLLLFQAVLLWWLCWDGMLGRVDALILLSIFSVVAIWTVRRGVVESKRFKAEMVDAVRTLEAQDPWIGGLARDIEENVLETEGNNPLPSSNGSVIRDSHAAGESERSYFLSLVIIAIGLFGLISGAQLMVFGAVNIARGIGVSELTIGLTIVAIGTSLPELATAILASRKRESEIVIGNVAGSNLFNLSAILGLVALIHPVSISNKSLQTELPILIGFTAFLLPLALCLRRIPGWAGCIYLVAFSVFMVWQILQG